MVRDTVGIVTGGTPRFGARDPVASALPRASEIRFDASATSDPTPAVFRPLSGPPLSSAQGFLASLGPRLRPRSFVPSLGLRAAAKTPWLFAGRAPGHRPLSQLRPTSIQGTG